MAKVLSKLLQSFAFILEAFTLFPFFASIFFILIFSLTHFSSPVYSLPKGERVLGGEVHFERLPGEVLIRASHNSLIEYDSFNIFLNERVQFIQPSSTSRVLNRVIGLSPSQIQGTLYANGIIYLINPSGIYFGPQALVDVAGLYAVAGQMSNLDFLQGLDHFDQLQGPITNQGLLSGKDFIYLIGEYVANAGSVVVEDGFASMLSGKNVLLGKEKEHIYIEFDSELDPDKVPASQIPIGVDQSGKIHVGEGEVFLGTGDLLYAVSVRHSGETFGKKITIDAGFRSREFVPMEISGVIEAVGLDLNQKGGSISITGDELKIYDAKIDASGQKGGGDISLGGSFQGKGPLKNAHSVFVDKDVSFFSNAYDSGNGGEIVLWADDLMDFHGSIEARGAEKKGDGGFVEVSGKDRLIFDGIVDLRAPSGQVGTLLLDPQTIVIQNSGSHDAQLPSIASADGSGQAYTISVEALLSNLALSNVTLESSSHITINDPIDASSLGTSYDLSLNSGPSSIITIQSDAPVTLNGALSLSSHFSININADVTTQGAIHINADQIQNGSGDFTLGSGATLTSNNHPISITSADITLLGNINSGTGVVELDISHVGSMGINTTNTDWSMNENQLNRIQGGSLSIGSDKATTLTIGGFTQNVTHVDHFSLKAQRIFSYFNRSAPSLTMEATNGIDVHQRLSTSQGDLILDGDLDGVAQGNEKVRFYINANSIQSERDLILSSDHGSISYQSGDFTLSAKRNLEIQNNSSSTVGSFHLIADSDQDDEGDLTLASGANLSASTMMVIRAYDLHLEGTISGNSQGVFIQTQNASTIGLGDAQGQMTISDAELDRINTSSTLTIGDAMTHTMNIDGLSHQKSYGLVLQAKGTSGTITLSNGAFSSDAPVILEAEDLIIFSSDFSTSDDKLTLITDDVQIDTGSISTGTGDLEIRMYTAGATLALGSAPGDLSLDAFEIRQLNVQNLILGSAQQGDMILEGVSASDTANISGDVTLLARGANASITLDSSAVYFPGNASFIANGDLSLQNDLTVGGDLSLVSESGALYLSTGIISSGLSLSIAAGDLILNSGLLDAGSNLMSIQPYVAGQMSVGQAGLGLSIENIELSLMQADSLVLGGNQTSSLSVDGLSRDSLSALNALELHALQGQGGITFSSTASSFDNLLARAKGTVLVDADITAHGNFDIEADFDGFNVGDYEQSASTHLVAQDTHVSITAKNFILSGSIDVGLGTLTLKASKEIDMLLGESSSKPFEVSNQELQNITASELIVTSDYSMDLKVNAISQTDSQFIDKLSLQALALDASVSFAGTGSSVFNTLSVQANQSIVISKDLSTTVGDLILDPDADNGGSGNNYITFQGVRALHSARDLEIAQAQGISRSGGETLTLSANRDLRINSSYSVGGSWGNRDLFITADSDSDGEGDFFLGALATLTTTSGKVVIQADDMDIQGAISSSSWTELKPRTPSDMGLGNAFSDAFDLTTDEVNRISAQGGVRIGGDTSAFVEVDGLNYDHAYELRIYAKDATGSISYTNAPSSNSVNGSDLYLEANQGVLLQAPLEAQSITVISDSDADGVGDFTLALGAPLLARANFTLTSNDTHLNDTMEAQGSALQFFTSDGGSVAVGDATGDLHLSRNEISLLTGQNLTIGNHLNALLTVDGLQREDTQNISNQLTLRATKVGGQLIFSGTDSVIAPHLNAQAKQDVQVLVNVTGDLSVAMTTTSGSTGGYVLVDATKTVEANSTLSISSQDLILDGNLVSLTQNVNLTGLNAEVLGVGDQSLSDPLYTFHLSKDEMDRISANKLNILTNAVSPVIYVNNISLSDNDGIAQQTSIQATGSSSGHAQVIFSEHPSSFFSALNITSRDGITFDVDVSFSGNSQFISDQDNDALGSLVLASGVSLDSSDSNLILILGDMDISGSINTGLGQLSLYSSGTNRSIALGDAVGDLSVSKQELALISTDRMLVGNTVTGPIVVDNLSLSDTANIVELDLVANRNQASVTFSGSDSHIASLLDVEAENGIFIHSNLTLSTETHFLSDSDRDAYGLFQVLSGKTLDSSANHLTIEAGDIDLLGSIVATGSDVGMLVSKSGRTMALGPYDAHFDLSSQELALVQAQNLNFGGDYNSHVYVGDILEADSQQIVDTVNIYAKRTSATVRFISGDSTFNSLNVESRSGFVINNDITTDTGSLTLVGNSLNSSSSIGSSQIAAGVTLTSAEHLELAHFRSTYYAAGGFSLSAVEDITLANGLNSQGQVQVTADSDQDGLGDFYLEGNSFLTSNGSVWIHSNDFISTRQINTGTANVYLLVSDAGSIGIGASSSDYSLSKGEISSITAQTLEIATGAQGGASVWIDQLAQSDTDSFNQLNIFALGGGEAIELINNASTFAKTISLQADAGIQLNESLTALRAVTLDADAGKDGLGDLTIASGKELRNSSSSDHTTLYANDLNLPGSIVSTGTGHLRIYSSDGGDMALGDTSAQFTLDALELERVSAQNLIYGNIETGSIYVGDLSQTQSDGIVDTIYLRAEKEGKEIHFVGSLAHFPALHVRAEAGISVLSDLYTDQGSIFLDGDRETGSSVGSITFSDQRVLDSFQDLELKALGGAMLAQGALTLRARGDIDIYDHLDTATTVSGPLNIFADSDANAQGVFALSSGKTINAHGSDITIYAQDLIFDQAHIQSVQGSLSLSPSTGSNVLLGEATLRDFNLSTAELSHLSLADLNLSVPQGGSLLVREVTESTSALITNGVRLDLQTGGGTRAITLQESQVFSALTVLSEGQITVQSQSITTTGGDLNISADTAQSGNTSLRVQLASNSTLTSFGDLSLGVQGSAKILSLGPQTLRAQGSIQIGQNYDLGGNLTLEADSEQDAQGAFILDAGALLTSQQFDVHVTAADSILDGTLSVAGAQMSLFSSDASSISLGDSTVYTHRLDNDELGRLTADVLFIGGDRLSNMDIQGLIVPNTIDLLLLQARGAQGTIVFDGGASQLLLSEISALEDIVIKSDVSISSSLTTPFYADWDEDGQGALILENHAVLLSQSAALDLSAADMDLVSGGIDTGLFALDLRSTNVRDIVLGESPGEFVLNTAELGNITASFVNLGDETTGGILVDGVLHGDTLSIGELNLFSQQESVVFEGGSSEIENLKVYSHQGVSILAPLTVHDDFIVQSDVDGDGQGLFSIGALGSLDTSNHPLDLLVADMDLQGVLTSGTGDVIILSSTSGSYGLGDASGDVSLSGSELSLMTSSGNVFVGDPTSGSIFVDNVQEQETVNITGNLILNATRDGESVHFSTQSSTFHTLTVLSDDGIRVDSDLKTTTGNLTLEADYDQSSDSFDELRMAAGVTLNAGFDLVMDATSGQVHGEGAVTLAAKNNILLNDDLTTSGETIIAADSDDDGTGDFIIPPGKVIDTQDNDLIFFTNRLDLDNLIDSGNAEIILIPFLGGSIGVGDINPDDYDLGITLDQLSQITTQGLVLGHVTSGSITVDGVSEISVSNIEKITLRATGEGQSVEFVNTPSFFKSLDVQADRGVFIEEDITTTLGDLLIDADVNQSGNVASKVLISDQVELDSAQNLHIQALGGEILAAGSLTLRSRGDLEIKDHMQAGGDLFIFADSDASGQGSFHLASGKNLLVSGHDLSLRASDLILDGASIDVGLGQIKIEQASSNTLGLGGETGALFVVSLDELHNMTADHLQFGGDYANQLLLGQLQDSDFSTFSSYTLQALAPGASMRFKEGPSSFSQLDARAHRGIFVDVDLSTLGGSMHLEADVLDTGHTLAKIVLKDGITLRSETDLILDATGGGIVAEGAVDIVAKNDVVFHNALNASGSVLLHADSDQSAQGALIVDGGKNLVGMQNMHIKAHGITLDGMLTLSQGTLHFSSSTESDMSLGLDQGIAFHLDAQELSRLQAQDLVLGGLEASDLYVSHVSSIAGAQNVSLQALKVGKKVYIENGPLSINSLEVLADQGIVVDTDLSTLQGEMLLDADANQSGHAQSILSLYDGISLQAHGNLTLRAQGGEIEALGAATFESKEAIFVESSLGVQSISGDLIFGADSDANATGALEISNGVSIDSGGNPLFLKGADLIFDAAFLNSHAADTHLFMTYSGTLGVGDATLANAEISLQEIQNITAQDLIIGDASHQELLVKQLQVQDMQDIQNAMVLQSLKTGASVTFSGSSWTFKALKVEADRGIQLSGMVATHEGDLLLDADVNQSNHASSLLDLSALTQLTSKEDLSLAALGGGIATQQNLTIHAEGDVMIDDALDAMGDLFIQADVDEDGQGSFILASPARITTNDHNLQIQSAAIDLGALVDVGLATLSLGSTRGDDLSLGDSQGVFYHLSSQELALIHARDLLIGNASTGDITLSNASGTEHIDTLTLQAMGPSKKITFHTSPSILSSLFAYADRGIVVNADLDITGDLVLDADVNQSENAQAKLSFALDSLIHATGDITLMAKGGGIVSQGALSIHADEHLSVGNSFSLSNSSLGDVSLLADDDGDGVGTLTLSSSSTLNTHDVPLILQGADLVMDGATIESGTADTHLLISYDASMGLGSGTGAAFEIVETELASIGANRLIFGDHRGGDIFIGNITSALTEGIENDVHIRALRQGSSVTFQGANTSFKALSVSSVGGIFVQGDLRSTVGSLVLDGDAQDSGNSMSSLTLSPLVTLNSEASMHLAASGGGVIAQGDLTFLAKDSLYLLDDVQVSGNAFFHADRDGTSQGEFYLESGKTIQASSYDVQIKAKEINLQGAFQAPTGTLTLLSTQGADISLGEDRGVSYFLSQGELARIQVEDLILGDETSGDIYVDKVALVPGISKTQLRAISTGKSIYFGNDLSRFSSLDAKADRGIFVDVPLQTDVDDLILDADANQSALPGAKIVLKSGVSLSAENVLRLAALGGGIVSEGALSLYSKGDLFIEDPMDAAQISAGSILLNADGDASGQGSLILSFGADLNTHGNPLTLMGADLVMDQAQVFSLGSSVTISPSYAGSLGIGEGTGKDFELSLAELQNVSSDDLSIGSNVQGDIFVKQVALSDSSQVNSQITLKALRQGSRIHFIENTHFKSLEVLADAGIAVQADITTHVGSLILDGDALDRGDKQSTLAFSQNAHLFSEGSIHLSAKGGGIVITGDAAFDAKEDIHLQDSLLTDADLSMHADFDGNSRGAFKLFLDKSLRSQGGDVQVISHAVELEGTIDVGLGSLSFTPSDGGDIDLGLAGVSSYHLSQGELASITASRLLIGDASSGDMYISELAALDTVGSLRLYATKSAKSISFTGSPSVFMGLEAHADRGIFVDEDLTTTQNALILDADANQSGDVNSSISFGQDLTLISAGNLELHAKGGGIVGEGFLRIEAKEDLLIADHFAAATLVAGETHLAADSDGTGTGVLRLASGVHLNSHGNPVTLMGRDLVMDGAQLEGTGAETFIFQSHAGTMGVGDATGADFEISRQELASMRADRLTIGNAVNGDLLVHNLQAQDSQGIGSLLLFQALGQGARVRFLGDSTFKLLEARADGGVQVAGDLTTTEGSLILDGDALERGDKQSTLAFSQNAHLFSEGSIHLSAKGGGIVITGDAVFDAKEDIHLQDSLLTDADLSIHADFDGNSTGVFKLFLDKSLRSQGGDVQVISHAVELEGTIDVGLGALSFTPSDGGDIDLGLAGVSSYHLSQGELASITASRLLIGDASSGDMYVSELAALDTVGSLRLYATKSAKSISFTGSPSVFMGLEAHADRGIFVDEDLTTTQNALILDADANQSEDVNSSISFGQDLTLISAGNLELHAKGGGIAGEGFLRIEAKEDLLIADHFAAATLVAGETYLAADSDGTGTGVLRLASGVHLNSHGNPVTLMGRDLVMDGAQLEGTGAETFIFQSHAGTMGVGDATGADFEISRQELASMRADRLTIGNAVNGDLLVHNLQAQDSQGIGSLLLFQALGQGARVRFLGDSTFKLLEARADGGVQVSGDLTTTVGSLILDGDALDRGDSQSTLSFSQNAHLFSEGSIHLSAKGGGMFSLGDFTLEAKEDIVLQDSLTVDQKALFFADSDENSTGNFLLAQGKVVETSAGSIKVSSQLLSIEGSLKAPLGTITLVPSDGADISIGSSLSSSYRLSSQEFSRLESAQLILGDPSSGSIEVGDLESPMTVSLDHITLNALREGESIHFIGDQAHFKGLEAYSDAGIRVFSQLISSHGDLLLNADANDVSSLDAHIIFEDGARLFSGGSMILDAKEGSIHALGQLDLEAKGDIRILQNLISQGETTIFADGDDSLSGNFYLAPFKSLDTSGHALEIRAFDIQMDDAYLYAEGASLHLYSSQGGRLFVGGEQEAYDYHVSSQELASIRAHDVYIGDEKSQSVRIEDFNVNDLEGISGGLFVQTGDPSGEISFSGPAIVARSLRAVSKGAITVDAPIETLSGDLILHADASHSFLEGTSIEIKDGLEIISQGVLSLESTGGIYALGALKLEAASHLLLENSLEGYGPIDLIADGDVDQEGRFSLADGMSIQTNGHALSISSAAFSMENISIDTSSAPLYLIAPDGQSIALGLSSGDYHVSLEELANIRTQRLVLGGDASSDIYVGALDPSFSEGIEEFYLQAGEDASIFFELGTTRVSALVAKAANDIEFDGDLVADGGDLFLEAVGGGILLGGDRHLSALGGVQLLSHRPMDVLGDLLVEAGDGVQIEQHLRVEEDLHLYADTDQDGQGAFMLAPSKLVEVDKGDMHIEAADIHLKGSLKTSKDLFLRGSEPNGQMFIGESTSSSYHVSLEELSSLQARDLIIGDDKQDRLVLFSTEASHFSGISRSVQLRADGQDASLVFKGGENTFPSLLAFSEGDIQVKSSLKTSQGDLVLKTGQGGFGIVFENDPSLSAKEGLFLEANKMQAFGNVDLQAAGDVDMLADLDAKGNVRIHAGLDKEKQGAFTLSSEKHLRSREGSVLIYAHNLHAQGAYLTAPLGTLGLYSFSGRDIFITQKQVPSSSFHVKHEDLLNMRAKVLEIGDERSGNLELSHFTENLSERFEMLSLKATKKGKSLFIRQDSVFPGLSLEAAGDVRIEGSLESAGPLVLLADSDNRGFGSVFVESIDTDDAPLHVRGKNFYFQDEIFTGEGDITLETTQKRAIALAVDKERYPKTKDARSLIRLPENQGYPEFSLDLEDLEALFSYGKLTIGGDTTGLVVVERLDLKNIEGMHIRALDQGGRVVFFTDKDALYSNQSPVVIDAPLEVQARDEIFLAVDLVTRGDTRFESDIFTLEYEASMDNRGLGAELPGALPAIADMSILARQVFIRGPLELGGSTHFEPAAQVHNIEDARKVKEEIDKVEAEGTDNYTGQNHSSALSSLQGQSLQIDPASSYRASSQQDKEQLGENDWLETSDLQEYGVEKERLRVSSPPREFQGELEGDNATKEPSQGDVKGAKEDEGYDEKGDASLETFSLPEGAIEEGHYLRISKRVERLNEQITIGKMELSQSKKELRGVERQIESLEKNLEDLDGKKDRQELTSSLNLLREKREKIVKKREKQEKNLENLKSVYNKNLKEKEDLESKGGS